MTANQSQATPLLIAFHSSRIHALIAGALLALAIALGGGGTPNPKTEIWLELFAGFAALAWVWAPGRLRLSRDPWLWFLTIVVLALPVVHLLPFPPSIWHALPGRAVQIEALELVDAADSWRPLSMSPPRTLASLLSLGAPLMLLIMTGALSHRERRWLIAAAVAMALATAFLGAFQLAGGAAAPRLYEESHQFVVTGFQASRNLAADILLIGLFGLAAIALDRRSEHGPGAPLTRREIWWLSGAAILLAVACILTASRAGIVLLVPAMLAVTAIFAGAPNWRSGRTLVAAIAGPAVLASAWLALMQGNTALQNVMARFDFGSDGRQELWRDTIYAAGQYWPYGSGIGSFAPSFIAFEPLEAVDSSWPNRAHNDYLELVLEAGLFGILGLILATAAVAIMAIRSWRRESHPRSLLFFGISVPLILAAHSLVDYPLRSMSLACLAAAATGMLAEPPDGPAPKSERSDSTA